MKLMAIARILLACRGGNERRTWFGLYTELVFVAMEGITNYLPLSAQYLVSYEHQLRHNTQNIQVHSIRK